MSLYGCAFKAVDVSKGVQDSVFNTVVSRILSDDNLYSENLAGRTLQLTLMCLLLGCINIVFLFFLVEWYLKVSLFQINVKKRHPGIIVYHSTVREISRKCRTSHIHMFVFSIKIGHLHIVYKCHKNNLFIFVSGFFLAFSPSQTTVPPGIAISQVSLVTFSTIIIRKNCWAMCDNIVS